MKHLLFAYMPACLLQWYHSVFSRLSGLKTKKASLIMFSESGRNFWKTTSALGLIPAGRLYYLFVSTWVVYQMISLLHWGMPIGWVPNGWMTQWCTMLCNVVRKWWTKTQKGYKTMNSVKVMRPRDTMLQCKKYVLNASFQPKCPSVLVQSQICLH